MILNPWQRKEPLDYTELARLLPAPGDPVLSDGRQRLLEDFLMSNVTEDARPTRTHRRLAIRVAAPLALAAALAGTVLATHQTTPHTASSVTASGGATAGNFPQQISTAAYTLHREPRGTVTVTIREAGAERPDLTRLQHDLERMGVPARVYQDDPSCPLDKGEDPQLGYRSLRAFGLADRNGGTAIIRPSEIPKGTHLEIVFPQLPKDSAQIDDFAFGLRKGKAPDCRHMFDSGEPPTATFEGEKIVPEHRS